MKKKLFRKDKFIAALIFVAVVAVMYVLKTPCVVEAVIGVPCPSCGMTRAWISALRLDLVSAFRYHSLFWTVPLIFAFFWFDGEIFSKKWLNIAVMVGIAVLFAARWIVLTVF